MKKIITIIIVAVTIVALGAGSIFAAEQVAKSSAIGQEAAQNFAFVDAGILPEEAEQIDVSFDFDDGRFVYDVEFVANGVKYDYDIDPQTGEVLEREMKVIDAAGKQATKPENTPKETKPEPASEPASQPAASDNKEAAPEINDSAAPGAGGSTPGANDSAAPGTGGSTPGTNDSAAPGAGASTPGTNDSAAPGTGSGSTPGANDSTAPGTGNTETPAEITIEAAKQIALQRAGLSAGSVVFSKAMLGWENGRRVYEIEFDLPGVAEYEYEIDIYTGAVLDEDIEPWVTADTYQYEPDDDYSDWDDDLNDHDDIDDDDDDHDDD